LVGECKRAATRFIDNDANRFPWVRNDPVNLTASPGLYVLVDD
jgi:hypothetical protein